MLSGCKEAVNNLNWVKLSSIGNSGVGKTCLVKTFCDSKFSKVYQETIGVDYGFKQCTINNKEVEVTFWDFGGSEEYNLIRPDLYKGTNICLLVYEVTKKDSADNLPGWLKEFKKTVPKDVPFAVVANKVDASQHRVKTKDMESWADDHKYKHYYTSAATG